MSERRKSVTTGRTNERTDSRNPIYPYLFFGGGIQILSKINFRNLKKIYISCKSTFFPFDPFSYKKKKKKSPPSKNFSVLIKFDTAHIFIPPAILREGVYSICPFVRECFPHCLCNSSLTTWWNWMNLTGNL